MGHLPITEFFGIDGEGQGRTDHQYILLAVSNAEGTKQWCVEDPWEHITTKQVLDFLLQIPLPRGARLFSFAFNYDLTKILADLPNKKLYYLFRPELRQRRGKEALKGPHPVVWKGYRLNLQGTKFTVAQGARRVVIWDLFKFYGTKFVHALRNWKVGTEAELDFMQTMKDSRPQFDTMSFAQVKAYCFKECQFMASLAKRLVEAHTEAGLTLKAFYGAGSSGAAMLEVMGIKEKIKPEPEGMRHAVACAFVGGRFENSMIGSARGPIYNYDISAAYPYQLTFLPCLEHGTWTHTKKRKELETCKQALVRYELSALCKDLRGEQAWAPFPFREEDGSISFPQESGGGWVYRDEYLAGERAFDYVYMREAWIYHTECDCQPFRDIPRYYLERVRLGKEGPGLVLKLGTNSCYGKIAQSVGTAMFNSWLWAGTITSGCRAQVLDLMALHKDRRNLLMIATDGVYTREKLTPPIPLDTNTWGAQKPNGASVPLGGWEENIVERGVFCARPGIYFPLEPSEKDLEKIRGRGVGKSVILHNWKRIIEAWEKHGVSKPVMVDNVSRFCGAKSSIHKSGGDKPVYKRADGSNVKEGKEPVRYGQWVTRKVEMSFQPMPKRTGIAADGQSLLLRRFPVDLESMPYSKAVMSQAAREMKRAELELIEQPDCDLSEYEGGD